MRESFHEAVVRYRLYFVRSDPACTKQLLLIQDIGISFPTLPNRSRGLSASILSRHHHPAHPDLVTTVISGSSRSRFSHVRIHFISHP